MRASGKKLTLDDINYLQSCMICNKLVADSDIKRVGLIVNVTVRAPLDEGWQKEIDKIIEQFQPPVWLYFGPTPSANPRVCHTWYSTFMPDASSVKDTQVNMPSVGGVRTKVLLTTSSPTLLNKTLRVAYMLRVRSFLHTASHNLAPIVSPANYQGKTTLPSLNALRLLFVKPMQRVLRYNWQNGMPDAININL
jgi:hypothetical protein